MSRHPGQPAQRGPSFWTRQGHASRVDRAAVREQIETAAQAERYRKLNLRALKSSSKHQALFRAISACGIGEPCGHILCARCARAYRLWLAPEILDLLPDGLPAVTATIVLAKVRGAALRNECVEALHDRTRKRLSRAGVRAAIGGTEAAYLSEDDAWSVHLHLLIFGDIKVLGPRLRSAFAKDGYDRAVKCQPLRDPVSQITYLQKFHTYHRPGTRGLSGKGFAVALRRTQIIQLARWSERRRLEDYLFLLGIRRRGSRFEAERGFEELRLEHRSTSDGGDGGDGGDAPKRRARHALNTP